MLGVVYHKMACAVAGRVELIQHVYLQRSTGSIAGCNTKTWPTVSYNYAELQYQTSCWSPIDRRTLDIMALMYDTMVDRVAEVV